MPRLKVTIGPHRYDMAIAHVNQPAKPTEINTDKFVGRVSVFVKDFAGVTPDGSPPTRDAAIFNGRSRKFIILIEGRWKQRPGVAPYTGDEIQFGSDFDFLPATFPHGPFNAGMRIAKMVDPATFYEEHPPSGRPFIMSPLLACMNTLCAYPAPQALSRALVLAHHDSAHPHHDQENHEGGFVPLETLEKQGSKRVEVDYWRFLGLKGQPAVDAFLAAHADLLPPPSNTSLIPSTTRNARSGSVSHIQTLNLGSLPATKPSPTDSSPTRSDSPASFMGWGAPVHVSDSSENTSRPATPTSPTAPTHKKKASRFSLATLLGALEKEAEVHLHKGDLITADQLSTVAQSSEIGGDEAVLKELGPWRFGEDAVDAIEDSNFVFLDPGHTRSVAQRRKHFVAEDGRFRKEFTFSPDVVYTSSFFTNFCDLNTLELRMGPVHLNISSHFREMPIRYTLRSTRLAPRPDGQPGEEDECFATIAFQLVDDDAACEQVEQVFDLNREELVEGDE